MRNLESQDATARWLAIGENDKAEVLSSGPSARRISFASDIATRSFR
jgi:hypothetical protein